MVVDTVLSVGDRVALAPVGLFSVYVEGTITSKREVDAAYEYKVNWDDNKHNGEWWNANDLDEPKPTIGDHLLKGYPSPQTCNLVNL